MCFVWTEWSRIGQQWIVVLTILWHVHSEMTHDLSHDLVAFPINFQPGVAVLGSPLQVDDAQLGTLPLGPVHAPQPAVATQHLEAGPDAQYDVRLLSGLDGPGPVDGPAHLALLPKVYDGVRQRRGAHVAAAHGGVAVLVGALSHVEQSHKGPGRTTLLADLHEHVAVYFGEGRSRQAAAEVETVAVLRHDVLQLSTLVESEQGAVSIRRQCTSQVARCDILSLKETR